MTNISMAKGARGRQHSGMRSRQPYGQHYVRDELVGPDAWRALVARYGGGDYLVPVDTEGPRGAELVAIIGLAAAKRLVAFASATRIFINGNQREVLAARRAEIRQMRDRGLTVREIARVAWLQRYSERQVARMLTQED